MIDYLEQGRTINGAYYAEELRRLLKEIARKRRGKLTRGVLLLQDNASAHTSQVVMTAATECGFEVPSSWRTRKRTYCRLFGSNRDGLCVLP